MGLPERPIYNDDGEIVDYEEYTIYFFEIRVFGGIELRNEVLISNPLAGASQKELPGPILIDTSEGDYNPDDPNHDRGWRRERFTYLGVAYRPNRARVWPQRFDAGHPSENVATVAQAEVFNSRSWDLWTQAWRVQLVPVTQWNEWRDELSLGVDEYRALREGGAGPEPDWVDRIVKYLVSIPADLADLGMVH
jgi:hypothetical protein